MRVLSLRIPDDRLKAALEVLDEHRFGYTVTDGAGKHQHAVLVDAVVPADAVEHLLEDLDDAGVDVETFTVSMDAEFARFEHVDEVQNEWGDTPNRIAPSALRSKAKDLRRNTRSFTWMMVLSAIVATAGLLLGSPAVVVGSMVIAPIVNPVLTASVGLVRNDRDMLVDSLHTQAIGLGVAIVTATVFGFALRWLSIVPGGLVVEQMRLLSLRISPSMLALAIGVSAGAAGAFGLATKGQVSIVGVMIAAALIPTAAAAGIGVAWGSVAVALGAALLLVLSMVAINAGAAAMLYYLDYRADEVDEPVFSFEDAGQAVRVAGTLVVTAGIVVAVGVLFAQQSGFERSVNEAVEEVLSSSEYGGVGVEGITVQYRVPGAAEDTVVTVELAHASGESYPSVAEDLRAAIVERTGQDVLVQVNLVPYERST